MSSAERLTTESFARIGVHAPLEPNVLPLFDITVAKCYAFVGCRLPNVDTHEASAWVQVPRSIDARAAYHYTREGIKKKPRRAHTGRFLFYRRAYARNTRRVVAVRVSSDADAAPGWHRAGNPLSQHRVLGGGAPTLFLEYRLADESSAEDGLTELDVQYGTHVQPPGYERVAVISPLQRGPKSSIPRVSLLARRRVYRRPPTPALTFRENGTFRILQIADLHFSVLEAACRDVVDVHACASHNDTLALVNRWLEEERPDVVAFTGDQLNGQHSSWDEQSIVPTWLEPVIARGIPWLPVFGNHDSESGLWTRAEQMRMLSLYPYALVRPDPPHVHGVGNFEVPVFSPRADRQELLTLWCLDSGSHPPFSLLRPWQHMLYDWVHSSQTAWMVETQRHKALGAWPYGAPQGQRRPPGIVFVHIPLQEAFDPVDVENGRELIVGIREEVFRRLGGQGRRGLFDAELAARDAQTPGVRLYIHGHMHNNADCRRVRGVWICFGGGASYAAYGKVGFARRVRVYEVSHWGEAISSWQRLEGVVGRVEETTLS